MDHLAAELGPERTGHGDFVREVLDRVGDKWTLLVVANLSDGLRRLRYLPVPAGTEITSGELRMLPGTRTYRLMRERTASPASWSP